MDMTFKTIKPKKLSSQIAEQIRSAILAGEYTPGDKLPSERELAEMFSVSRPSVREALYILASAGLTASHQGEGTVVLSLLEAADLNPFSELKCNQGKRTGCRKIGNAGASVVRRTTQ